MQLSCLQIITGINNIMSNFTRTFQLTISYHRHAASGKAMQACRMQTTVALYTAPNTTVHATCMV